jgi:diguanylate cyclase (GGDEF)-like protein
MRLLPTGLKGSFRGLFATYAAASLVPVVALGVVLAQGNQKDSVQRGLQYGLAHAAVIEETAIAPALRGDDLADGLTSGERQRLRAATDLAIFRGSVLRLRLRSFDGVVVFSDDGSVDGALPTGHPAFAAAVHGDADVAVLPDASPGRAVRVVQPVFATASGRSVGVLEIHLPYDAVAADLHAATVRTYWRLTAGLGVLYLVLAAISWSATQRLRRHAAHRERQAMHDPLTGLPNRELFRQHLVAATGAGDTCAVVLVDLDRFKIVNDTLGHHAGDELLQVVAARLRSGLRPQDTIARLGGDEFGLLLPGVDDDATAADLLSPVRERLGEEIVLDGVPVTIEASFGVALYPRHATDVEPLLRCADAAMYHGKRGTAGVVVFDDSLAAPPSHHLTIQRDVRRAIDHDELVLHYQPKVDLGSGQTTCLEALVRWQHPERGLLPPADFLPAVEQSGLINPLTGWVLRRALTDCAQWAALGRDWAVAVNVSARNLDSTEFADLVAHLLEDSGVAASRLHLEVTETALSVDLKAATATIEALARLGVGLALDDFGVGYASLAHLRSLALTEVKIDRGFVTGVEGSGRDREVVLSLIQLAHGLGLRVTAEGVESWSTGEWLRTVGCDSAQGYHFARPAPWTDLLDPVAVTSPAGPVPAEART